jgi:predicted ATP-dependent serine protease
VKESKKLGFRRCVLPRQNQEKMKDEKEIDLVGVETIQQAMEVLF